MQDSLSFNGVIKRGLGKYSKELHIPGRDELPDAPEDWPRKLETGSLNVLIYPNGYPVDLISRNLGDRLGGLDSGMFEPSFCISQDMIGNNTLCCRNENDNPLLDRLMSGVQRL